VIEIPEFYHYKGSLTTPPCNEIVSWFVYKHPLEISSSSIVFLENAWVNDLNFSGGRGNYRFPQYLNGRKVFEVSAEIKNYFQEVELETIGSEKIIYNLFFLIVIIMIL